MKCENQTAALRSKFRMPRFLPVVGRAVFVLACAFALYRSVRLGVADAFAFRGTSAGLSKAIAIEPASEKYLAREAIWRSDSGDLSPEVDHRLARALAMNPLDSSVMMTLGLRAEMRGDQETAERQLARAAEVDHTFKPTWTLANYYFRNDQTEKFWPQISRCLSLIEPKSMESWSFDPAPIFDLCWNRTQDSKKILELVPQRHGTLLPYLAYLVEHKHPDAAIAAWPRVLAVANMDDAASLTAFCDFLIQMNRAQEAVDVWNQLVDRRYVRSTLLNPRAGISVADPDFAFPVAGSAFGWRVARERGAFVSVAPHRLAFEYTGEQPENFDVLWKMAPVLPGRVYRLKWKTDASRLNLTLGTDPGFMIRFSDEAGELTPVCSLLSRQTNCEIRTSPRTRLLWLRLRYTRALGTTRVTGTLKLESLNLELLG
jgi:tetratricopeptide (TPR) repeat protein